MNTGDTLIRDTDGKRFKVLELGFWSKVVADDGEIVSVKWAIADRYVGSRGPTFTLEETPKP